MSSALRGGYRLQNLDSALRNCPPFRLDRAVQRWDRLNEPYRWTCTVATRRYRLRWGARQEKDHGQNMDIDIQIARVYLGCGLGQQDESDRRLAAVHGRQGRWPCRIVEAIVKESRGRLKASHPAPRNGFRCPLWQPTAPHGPCSGPTARGPVRDGSAPKRRVTRIGHGQSPFPASQA